MLLADAAKGLFHRAIAQSGSTDSVTRGEAENAVSADDPGHRHSSTEITVALLEAAGIVPDREAARGYAETLPDADLLEFLRGRSAREIIDVYRNADRPERVDVPILIRDGALLPRGDWLSAFRAGRFNAVPIMLGSNRDEMKLFLSQDEKHVRRGFGVLYSIRDPEDYERRAQYHSALWTIRAVAGPASAMADSGFHAIYAYRFDWDDLPEIFGMDFSEILGAAHGFELPFVFGNFELGASPLGKLLFDESSEASRQALASRMMGYWGEFARSGRPGRGGDAGQVDWPAWTRNQAQPVTKTGHDDDLANSPGSTSIANVLVLDRPEAGGIRIAEMASSREQVIAAVDAEPGLGQDEKCALFFELFADRPEWNADEYRRIGRRGCADFPPDAALR